MLNRCVLSLVFVAVTSAGYASVPAPASAADSIAKDPALSTLNGLIAQAGLSATLQGSGPFSIFAPSNDAFKLVPAKTMDDLVKHPDQLKTGGFATMEDAMVQTADIQANNGIVHIIDGVLITPSKK